MQVSILDGNHASNEYTCQLILTNNPLVLANDKALYHSIWKSFNRSHVIPGDTAYISGTQTVHREDVDFRDFDMKNGKDFHALGIKTIDYAFFVRIGIAWGYTFTQNGDKVRCLFGKIRLRWKDAFEAWIAHIQPKFGQVHPRASGRACTQVLLGNITEHQATTTVKKITICSCINAKKSQAAN